MKNPSNVHGCEYFFKYLLHKKYLIYEMFILRSIELKNIPFRRCLRCVFALFHVGCIPWEISSQTHSLRFNFTEANPNSQEWKTCRIFKKINEKKLRFLVFTFSVTFFCVSIKILVKPKKKKKVQQQ